MQYTHNTNGKTCTREITVDVDEQGIIQSVKFSGGGCQGNLIAISGMLVGKEAKEVQKQFEGIPCGNKGTSCADQLAQLLKKVLSVQNCEDVKNCFFHNEKDCNFFNDTCEKHLDCVFRTNKIKYEEIVSKVSNGNTSSVL